MPLGTLYAATASRENGSPWLRLIACLKRQSRWFRQALLETIARTLSLSTKMTLIFLSKMCLTRMREVAWEIAKAARQFGAVAIVHGSDSTDNSVLFLENGFDYVLCGEAEETLVQLCISVLNSEGIPEIAGMVRIGKDGRPLRSPVRLAKNPAWPASYPHGI